jgi:hypothetical protein
LEVPLLSLKFFIHISPTVNGPMSNNQKGNQREIKKLVPDFHMESKNEYVIPVIRRLYSEQPFNK